MNPDTYVLLENAITKDFYIITALDLPKKMDLNNLKEGLEVSYFNSDDKLSKGTVVEISGKMFISLY